MPAWIEILYFDKWTRVAEVLGVFGNGITIQAGVTGVLHQVFELFLPSLFPQFTEVAPVSFWVFTVGFYRFRHIPSG